MSQSTEENLYSISSGAQAAGSDKIPPMLGQLNEDISKSFFVPPSKTGDLKDANFPRDDEGRVYHLGVKRGEVCNRIVTVGDPARASVMATLLDNPTTTFMRASSRGFVIHTGRLNGVPLSIIATGMGIPMMDFMVRECRAIVEGPMIIARFGTCGTPQTSVPIGSVVVASKGSVGVFRNVDAFAEDLENGGEKAESAKALKYYTVSKISPADPLLSSLLTEKLNQRLPGEYKVVEGLNATADSFYSSQGRVTNDFDDHNETLIDELLEIHPTLSALEMETFHLLHLAQCSRGTIHGAAATIVLAQRKSGGFLSNAEKRKLEKSAGFAVMEAVAAFPLDDEHAMKGGCVWEQ